MFNNSINTVDWIELNPEQNNYFFTVKDFKYKKIYSTFFSLKNIFKMSNIGIASGKDEEFVKFNISDFDYQDQKMVADYFYRPFDNRKILYDLKKLQRARFSIMKNVQDENIILCLGRFAKNDFPQASISNILVCRHSVTDMTYIFPLYILSNGEDKFYISMKEPTVVYNTGEKPIFNKTDNFTKEFLEFFKSKYKRTYTPEQILGYIYAILYSPTYRTKYIEFLKIDFPRISFTKDEKLFNKLSEIGFELIEHHLLKRSYKNDVANINGTTANYKVEKVVYENGKVWINKDRYFDNIPVDIWNFYIGGYQVLDKWLKERKKHNIELSAKDIQHFIKVVNILDFTIKTMTKIDNLTEEWI